MDRLWLGLMLVGLSWWWLLLCSLTVNYFNSLRVVLRILLLYPISALNHRFAVPLPHSFHILLPTPRRRRPIPLYFTPLSLRMLILLFLCLLFLLLVARGRVIFVIEDILHWEGDVCVTVLDCWDVHEEVVVAMLGHVFFGWFLDYNQKANGLMNEELPSLWPAIS